MDSEGKRTFRAFPHDRSPRGHLENSSDTACWPGNKKPGTAVADRRRQDTLRGRFQTYQPSPTSFRDLIDLTLF
jgi:hypothetical protein